MANQAALPSMDSNAAAPDNPARRKVLASASSVAMAGGLCAGYGTFGAMAARYLYPAQGEVTAWMFVTPVTHLQKGESMTYRSPTGAPVVIARNGDSGTEADFIALSSTCPHLGCQVRWETAQHRFVCPCHNGIFDARGKATAGPPADAGQSLPRYPLKVENGLLFIDVPTEKLG